MRALPDCDKVLLGQAELDGELGAAEAAALAVHREQCPTCRSAAAQITRARQAMREVPYHRMPDETRARIIARLGQASADLPAAVQPQPRRWWPSWSAGAGFGLGACATTLALLLVSPPGQSSLAEQIVAGHIRALQPGHLEDVRSSDRHTVKPWFDGRVDFAPPVKDLAAERFPLIGARLDYLDQRPVAALVYQRDKHIINLFVWPTSERAAQAPQTAQRQGYNLVHWMQNGMAFWAVSDVEMSQLQEFAQDWQHKP